MELVTATAAQQVERDHLTAAAWGAGLSTAQFLEREQRLRAHPWAAGAMTTWLWRDAARVLASCETFTGPARVGARDGVVAVVASVFVEPALRGGGHASALLTALAARLRGEGHLGVTLFSEVGTGLYQRLGFWPVPAFDTLFAPLPSWPAGVERLEGLLPAPRRLAAPADTLRLHSMPERLGWHLERERFTGAAWGRPALEVHGARLGESTCTWTAYWKTNELQVLTLDVADDAHREALVAAARHAAHLVGLPTVRVWETLALDDLPGARRAPRTDEIAMFHPFVAGVQAWTQVERALWA